MIKRAAVILAALLMVVGTASAVTVTVDDIIKLHQEGVSPEVIKTFIKSSGQKFELTAEDILKMKKAGVPEEVIEFMLETSAPPPPVTPPSRTGEGGDIEPGFEYRARYHSVFDFQVFRKKFIKNEKTLEVGKRDMLRNTAKRSGTLFLTESEIIMFDMDGDERFRLEYKDITRLRIQNRYRGDEARFHPLDSQVLWIYFKKDGEDYFVRVFTLPRPDKKDPNYGNTIDIAKAIQEYGKDDNPRLAEPLKIK